MDRLFKIIQSNIEPKLRELGGYDPAVGSVDFEPADGLKAGDILGITRAAGYEHYAVYIGDNRVIHFAAEEGDFGEAAVREAPLSDFLDGQREFFVLDFSCIGKRPTKKAHGSPENTKNGPAVLFCGPVFCWGSYYALSADGDLPRCLAGESAVSYVDRNGADVIGGNAVCDAVAVDVEGELSAVRPVAAPAPCGCIHKLPVAAFKRVAAVKVDYRCGVGDIEHRPVGVVADSRAAHGES